LKRGDFGLNKLEEARELFAHDLYASELTGAVIDEIGDSYAKCSLILSDKHRNAYGGIMGGAIYTLADLAFAVASNFDKEEATVSLSTCANFMSASKGSILYAEAKLIKDGRRNCFYEVRVTDDLGKDIAEILFTGAHL
jgi:acyl-CoA thioesterase